MRVSSSSLIMLSLLALSACNRAPQPDQDVAASQTGAAMEGAPATTEAIGTDKKAAAESPALAVEAEGLRLFNPETGAARPIAFGTPRAQVLADLAFRGPPGTGTNGECGAGPLQYANWPDGLGLFFQGDKFAGWNTDERGKSAIATASGIGPGSTRAELEGVYKVEVSEMTLGTEFAAGGLYGILDSRAKTGKITNMWAGVSCNFR